MHHHPKTSCQAGSTKSAFREGGIAKPDFGWRLPQTLVMAGAVALWLGLWLAPEIALGVLWNGIVPMAPLIFVVATGLWRNLCPLGSFSLLPRRLGISQRRRLSAVAQARLQLAGVLVLLMVIPLRRVILDLSGPASAITLLLAVLLAAGLGRIYEFKSAWCAGACPVLAVETLYGSKPLRAFTNAHCTTCQGCVMRCPDSLGSAAASQSVVGAKRLAVFLMTGGFAGFVAGWMHVPDYPPGQGWQHLGEAYGYPAFGMGVSLGAFAVLRRLLPASLKIMLPTFFAASSVIIYYWYRLPSLLGFSLFPDSSESLLNLRHLLPPWSPWALRFFTVSFFLAWFFRHSPSIPWMPRPRVGRPAR